MPGNQEIQVLLGMAYEKAGNDAKAKETYQDVLKTNPNNAGAQAGLKRVE
jgi:Tfp pilus assembly protein PilF